MTSYIDTTSTSLYLLITTRERKRLRSLIDRVSIHGSFFDFIEYLLFLIHLDLNESRTLLIMICYERVLEST